MESVYRRRKAEMVSGLIDRKRKMSGILTCCTVVSTECVFNGKNYMHTVTPPREPIYY
jgi:hypothetical protein